MSLTDEDKQLISSILNDVQPGELVSLKSKFDIYPEKNKPKTRSKNKLLLDFLCPGI